MRQALTILSLPVMRRLIAAPALALFLTAAMQPAAAQEASPQPGTTAPQDLSAPAGASLSEIWTAGERLRARNGPGDMTAALDHFQRAHAMYRQEFAGQLSLTPQIVDVIAETATSLERFDEARDARREAVEWFSGLGSASEELADAWKELGWAERARKDHAAARDAYVAARAVLADLPQTPSILIEMARTFVSEGVEFDLDGDLPSARTRYLEGRSRLMAIAAAADTDAENARAADELRAIALSNLASIAGKEQKPAEQNSWRWERIGILRSIAPGSVELSDALVEQAKAYGAMDEHWTRLTLLDEALQSMRGRQTAPSEIATLQWERGLAFFYLDRKDRAVDAYSAALEATLALPEPREADAAALLGNIAGALGDLKRYEEQEKYRARQLAYLRRIAPGTVELADALGNLAYARSSQGRWSDTIALRNEEIALRRSLQPGSIGLAGALGELAYAHVSAKAWKTALALREEEIAIRRALEPESENLAYALDDYGASLIELQRHQDAIAPLTDAVRLYLAIDPDNKAGAISSRIRLGMAYNGAADYDRANEAFAEALEWIDTAANPDKRNVAAALSNMGQLAKSLGRYAQAEALTTRQIALLREIDPGSSSLAYALLELVAAHQRLSRYEYSLQFVYEARAILEKSEGPISLGNYFTYDWEGQGLEGAKRYAESLAAYNKGEEILLAAEGPDALDYAYLLNNRAWAYRWLGDLERSESDFVRATQIMEAKLGPTHRFTNIGYSNSGILAHLRGRHEDAIRLSMRALPSMLRERRTTLEEQRWTYETLANAFKSLGDTRRAIMFAKQAINAQQELRANNKELDKGQIKEFKAEWRRLYENLAEMLIAEGRISEAQAVLQMEKEEELVDFIQRDASVDLRDTRAPLTPREEGFQGDIAAMVAKPMEVASAVSRLAQRESSGGDLTEDELAQLDVLEAMLDEAYEEFIDDVDKFMEVAEAEAGEVRREVDAINLSYTASVQDELREFDGRAAMLQVASLGSSTHLFLTVPEASIHREVSIPRAELSRLVFEALTAIEGRSADANLRLRALYDVLVAPVRTEIDQTGAKTLMLNLQGFLRYVPFAALHDGERYLIEDYALALYTPAARTRFESRDRAADRSAGFGVTGAHPGFSPLPGVAREIQAIFGGAGAPGALSGQASLDTEFTRDRFRDALKERPEIVHIASHFKLVPGRETDSFLLLGDGSPLSLADLRKGRGFRFGGVDLLTLSACQTARGGGSEGDEVESFGALAQMNGASSVMATLWPVADDATAILMQTFYRNLVEGGMDKAEALRAAQLSLIGSDAASASDERAGRKLAKPGEEAAPATPVGHAHPYFWSPFILMGNWL